MAANFLTSQLGVTAAQITDSTTAGRSLLTAADAAAQRALLGDIGVGTAVATTSGTSIDFTGIPAGVKRLTVMLTGVSTSGASLVEIRLGVGGVYDATGYTASSASVVAGSTGAADSTSGALVNHNGAATHTRTGIMQFNHMGSNAWVFSGIVRYTSAAVSNNTGSKTTSGTVDGIRITTVNGTDTFDAGSVNIMWEL